MAGQRQPIELVQARGAKHLTKQEIEARKAGEIKPYTDDIRPPDYLSKKQKSEFDKIAGQLMKLKVMGETDVDALARYIIAGDLYVTAVKKLRKKETQDSIEKYDFWSKKQDLYFRQCRSAASDLGMTISSRCKLVIPQPKAEEKKENKFRVFEKAL